MEITIENLQINDKIVNFFENGEFDRFLYNMSKFYNVKCDLIEKNKYLINNILHTFELKIEDEKYNLYLENDNLYIIELSNFIIDLSEFIHTLFQSYCIDVKNKINTFIQSRYTTCDIIINDKTIIFDNEIFEISHLYEVIKFIDSKIVPITNCDLFDI